MLGLLFLSSDCSYPRGDGDSMRAKLPFTSFLCKRCLHSEKMVSILYLTIVSSTSKKAFYINVDLTMLLVKQVHKIRFFIQHMRIRVIASIILLILAIYNTLQFFTLSRFFMFSFSFIDAETF